MEWLFPLRHTENSSKGRAGSQHAPPETPHSPLKEDPGLLASDPVCCGEHIAVVKTLLLTAAGPAVSPWQGLKATSHLSSEDNRKPGQPQGESKAGQSMPDTWSMSSWAWLTGAAGVGILEGFLGEVPLTPRFVGKWEVNHASSSCKHMSLETEKQSP